MDDRVLRVINNDNEFGRWELAYGAPHPALRGLVLGYCGYTEEQTDFAARLEVPHPNVVLILNLGPAIRVNSPTQSTELGSFIAGLHDRPVHVAATGPMRCLQVDLTPAGARLLLDQPLAAFANAAISLNDLGGQSFRCLEERLDALPSWTARFDLLDRVLRDRCAAGRAQDPRLGWAAAQMLKSAGSVTVSGLASELGWSRKHLTCTFHDEFGIPPKAFARVVRFDRAIRSIGEDSDPDWLTISFDSGYFDQSHFIRDFRDLAGITPTDYARRRMPEGGVRSGESPAR